MLTAKKSGPHWRSGGRLLPRTAGPGARKIIPMFGAWRLVGNWLPVIRGDLKGWARRHDLLEEGANACKETGNCAPTPASSTLYLAHEIHGGMAAMTAG